MSVYEFKYMLELVGREDPQVSLGWASWWNVIFFLSVLWHCWLGDRKGIRPVKRWMLVYCWLVMITTHHLHHP